MAITAEPRTPPEPDIDRPPARVLVVDDHAGVRAGVVQLLERDPDFVVAGEAGDGASAIVMARAVAPDVVLLDVSMPGVDGLAAVPVLRALPCHPEVVLFTALADHARVDGL